MTLPPSARRRTRHVRPLLPLLAAAVVLVATTGLSAAGQSDDDGPELMGLPPATAQVDIAPVLELVGATTPLVAPVGDLITRTASPDGSVGHDSSEERERYTLAGDVFFDTDSADLTERAQDDLEIITQELDDAEIVSLTVIGHTDSVDSDAYNEQLSLERATAVQELMSEHLPGVEIAVEGRGENDPVAAETGSPEEVDQARALNRRVEIDAVLAAPHRESR